MRYSLRPYQSEAVDAGTAYLMDKKMRGKNGIIVAPTGSGKSLVIAGIADALDGPSLVFQPSKEILEQNAAKLAGYGYRASIFSASLGRREIGTITLATIGSVMRYTEAFKHIRYVLVDECHLVSAQGGMYNDFLRSQPNVRVLGLTATPYRLASNSYGSQLRFLTRVTPRFFNHVVHHTQIGTLFDDGYLAPLQYDEVDLLPHERLKLNTKGSDYTDASVLSLFGEVGFVGALQRQVEKALDEGRRNVLVFTRFVQESERLAKVVPGCAVVTADTHPRERAQILADFRRGKIRCVSNVGIIALGFDYPELECVILGRPSISLALYYQQVGREIRPLYAPGFDMDTAAGRRAAIAASAKPRGYVIDMVGLVKQFGKVEDLNLQPGGARGAQWSIAAGQRPLTNVYFADRDGKHATGPVGVVTDPKALAKQARKRSFWARRAASR